jgi:hypothetical protein
MNREYIVRHQIERLGCNVELVDGEWTSVPFKALISPLWRKKSSNFEEKYTQLGGNLDEYYLYIGSSNHIITDLSDDALLVWDDEKYEFKHKDVVKVDDEVLYYNGILRKLKGDNDEH